MSRWALLQGFLKFLCETMLNKILVIAEYFVYFEHVWRGTLKLNPEVGMQISLRSKPFSHWMHGDGSVVAQAICSDCTFLCSTSEIVMYQNRTLELGVSTFLVHFTNMVCKNLLLTLLQSRWIKGLLFSSLSQITHDTVWNHPILYAS